MTIEIKNGKVNVNDLGTDSNDLFMINCIVDLLFHIENFYSVKYRYPHDFKELYLWIKNIKKEKNLPFNEKGETKCIKENQ